MIVSHRYKCVFVAAPKAGSTAIESLFWEPSIKGERDLINYDLHANKHLPYRDIIKLVPEASSYFAFALIRNPRAVVVSQFHMWKERLFPYSSSDLTFERWVLDYDHLLVPKFSHIVAGVPNLYRYENVQEVMNNLLTKLAVPAQFSDIPVVNFSRNKTPWQAYYTNSAVSDRVDRLYAEELKLWRSL